ncbi:MAG: hypothetical protein NTU41_09815, partial [Chloroflexi bacterium]|nr:hypothetical protein [Chloroflexota bacterium]
MHDLNKMGDCFQRAIGLIPGWVRRRTPARMRAVASRWQRQPETVPAAVFDVWTSQAGAPPTKQALLSYITAPFRMSDEDPSTSQFSNNGIAKDIVRTLNQIGYIVDIVEWTDTIFAPKKPYDLFVGHGGWNFEHIIASLPPRAKKICFSTGLYWQEHNRREEERFRWLEERRGVRLAYDRWIERSEECANQSADGIICLGNRIVKDSYSKFPLVVNLNNAAYHDDRYDTTRKDFATGRSNFLFFSGGG